MATTVTDITKRILLEHLFSSTQNIGVSPGDSDRYYLGIGRAEEWDSDNAPPVPNSGVNEQLRFQESLQSIQIINNISYVVPRYNWTAGNVYSAWSNDYGSDLGFISSSTRIEHPYYVITDDLQVFVCIQQGKTAQGVSRNSLYKPTDTSGVPFAAGDDGYIWQFLFAVDANRSRNFLTSSYIPVEKILDSSEGGPLASDLSVARTQQLALQKAAKTGQILGVAVDSGGTGYTSAPTVTITPIPRIGSTTIVEAAQAIANVNSNGQVYEIVMKDSANAPYFTFGEGYKHAHVSVTGGGGSGAVLRPLITFDSGLQGNHISSLSSSGIMFSNTLTGNVSGDFNVVNDFRQIGIIKNPLKDSADFGSFTGVIGDSAVSSATAQAYHKLYVSGSAGFAANITGDQTLQQSTSGAKAILDYFDAANEIAYVHQTRVTGFTAFDSTNNISFLQSGSSIGTCAIVANTTGPNLRPAEVNNFSGEVIYIDNRSPITRDDEQTEDIKIVIDL